MCCVFVLFVFILCTLCCQFLWIVVVLFVFILCTLCCQFLWIVFVLFVFILCTLCCQFLWIVFVLFVFVLCTPGVDPGFQVRGGALRKIAPIGGRRENFGVFRVKNNDFTPKNHIFSNCGGRRENFGVFRLKNHDYTPKNHIFPNFRGGARRVRPLDPPLNPSLHLNE